MISSLSNRPWILYGNPALDPSGGTGFAEGSVIFAGAGGVLTEDNPPLSYNPITNNLTSGVFSASLASFPRLRLVDTSQVANSQMFQIMNSGLTLRLKAVNDAETVAQPGIVLDRVGFISGAGQPSTYVTNSGTQSLTNNVPTAIAFNTETYDIGGCHDNAVNNTRLTVPTGGDGTYLMVGTVSYAANNAGLRAAFIILGGATGLASIVVNAVVGDITSVQAVALQQLTAGQYVELWGFQTSGGALNANAGCVFSWIKVW
jgi:hypothetical protein